MEKKTWVKFSHFIVFFLLATSFETLMARKESAGQEVIQLFKELTSVDDQVSCKGKQMWPELVGVPAKMAEEIIKKENSFITETPIILAGSPVPLDFRCFRVFIVDNILGYVVQIPVVG